MIEDPRHRRVAFHRHGLRILRGRLARGCRAGLTRSPPDTPTSGDIVLEREEIRAPRAVRKQSFWNEVQNFPAHSSWLHFKKNGHGESANAEDECSKNASPSGSGFTSPLLLALPPVAAMAMDLDKKVAFNIPAQDLSGALIEFSKQARLQVIVSDDLTGQTTRGVSGQKAIRSGAEPASDPAGLRLSGWRARRRSP